MLADAPNDPKAPQEGAPIVYEYFKRKALAEIGLTTDLGKLPAWKAEAFYVLAKKIGEHQAAEHDKLAKKRGKRG